MNQALLSCPRQRVFHWLLTSCLWLMSVIAFLSSRSYANEEVSVDPTYFNSAVLTGGDFYFWKPGEFGMIPGMNDVSGEVPVLLAYGDLQGTEREFSIAVDSAIPELSFFAGVQRQPWDWGLTVRRDKPA